ncbi:SdiA-regulated domain-containing protein [Persicitalea jodogahamensis]|uniref:Uncharacterized protein n=1 Tax=Persicitalea jodogahamensis TaxID=402147 RepID=A0A8J3CZ91_9BACT|nr:SdiA-regulated domain-containing protein [Persicitalea jodogahamensis]GHB51844.1 hypothetical protein GCM10007390_00520 [Persicitalea jodogahamensis]
MGKFVYFWFALKVALCGCGTDKRENGFDKARSAHKVSKIGRLPAIANESSGLARNDARGTLWTHNDSGGQPELYEVDMKGNLLSTLPVPDARNVDWEDMAQSPDGTLYIGDLGNNANERRDLTIYALSLGAKTTAALHIQYADQKDFPPVPDARNFDCEAFFYHNNHLYLFSKNRSKTNQYVKLYESPVQPGDYTLPVKDSVLVKDMVTAADINPSGTAFALLTYGRILIFEIKEGRIDFNSPSECIKIGKAQQEALIFLNDNDLLMTNEQGQMYRIRRR